MERNENGMPVIPKDNRSVGCLESGDSALGDKLLAYAYVPIQRYRMLYTPEEGLSRGTLFEELDKPMEVYGNE